MKKDKNKKTINSNEQKIENLENSAEVVNAEKSVTTTDKKECKKSHKVSCKTQFCRFKQNAKYYLLDHPKLKYTYEYGRDIFLSIISAFLFAYGFRAFTAPQEIEPAYHLISGGASGIAQVIIRFINLFSNNGLSSAVNGTLQSVLFFVVNIPVILFAWFKIGKRFTITTLINVGMVSLFNQFLPHKLFEIISFPEMNIARPLFAGLLTGLSSALAYAIASSTGGMDVIAMYIAEKKSTQIGKFAMTLNAVIVCCYVSLTVLDYNIHQNKVDPNVGLTDTVSNIISMALYTMIYYFTSSKVVDVLHTKNKKTVLNIVTNSDILPKVLVSAFPHAGTYYEAKGAFSDKKVLIIYMVVSNSEVKQVVEMCHKVDRTSFISAVQANQVYGSFYIKPIK